MGQWDSVAGEAVKRCVSWHGETVWQVPRWDVVAGGTVTVWQVARWDGGSVARSSGDVAARRHNGTMEWWHDKVAVTRYMEPWRHGHLISALIMLI